MEISQDYRPWDSLMPDILGLVFKRLSLDDMLKVIPSVCKSWGNVIKGPYCWQEIDIEDWSESRGDECVDRMLILLIGRSSGSLQKLCVHGLQTESSLSLIGDNAKNLRNLRLPGSEISNSMMEQIARQLSNLTSLDISDCEKLNAVAIEAIGKYCKKLRYLQRNVDNHGMNGYINHFRDSQSADDEAFAIAATMPQLKSLELAFMAVTTKGLLRILAKCHELEFLDIRGCIDVELDEKFLTKFTKLKVMGPWGHAFISLMIPIVIDMVVDYNYSDDDTEDDVYLSNGVQDTEE